MKTAILLLTRAEIEALSILVAAAQESGVEADGHLEGLEQIMVKLEVALEEPHEEVDTPPPIGLTDRRMLPGMPCEALG